jgi:hypothetical protein
MKGLESQCLIAVILNQNILADVPKKNNANALISAHNKESFFFSSRKKCKTPHIKDFMITKV